MNRSFIRNMLRGNPLSLSSSKLKGGLFFLFMMVLFYYQYQVGTSVRNTVKEESTTFHINVNDRQNFNDNYSPKNSYKFVIMTKSAPDKPDVRRFLRKESWLSYQWKDAKNANISWRHFFLVGLSTDNEWPRSKLENENSEFSDIIISETLDVYKFLTFKMMWGMEYAIENFDSKFLVILSEDTIVNVAGLDEYLTDLTEQGKDKFFYGGPLCHPRKVFRTGKWGTSKGLYPPNTYPNYCVGSGLIISFDTIRELLRVWNRDRQPISFIDDVHIGLLLFYSGKIEVTDIDNVTFGCQARRSDSFIVSQIKPLSLGAELMRNYKEHGYYCEEDVPPHKP